MEDLNKNQLILLVLLVTFVTSIATGIMTVALLQQAPVEITRNINNIVERTIEKVTPAGIVTAPKDVTTVVVKEEDSIVNAINKNLKSIVRLSETNLLGIKNFYGLGVVLTKEGIIGTDRKEILPESIYMAKFNDGSEWKLIPMGVDKNTNSIFFKVNLPEKTKYDFSPARISVNDLQLGQSVVGLGGELQNAVAVGRVTSFVMKETGTGTTTTKYISGIESDVSSKDLLSGSPFFNLTGDLVGLKLSESSSGYFVPIATINKELNFIQQSL